MLSTRTTLRAVPGCHLSGGNFCACGTAPAQILLFAPKPGKCCRTRPCSPRGCSRQAAALHVSHLLPQPARRGAVRTSWLQHADTATSSVTGEGCRQPQGPILLTIRKASSSSKLFKSTNLTRLYLCLQVFICLVTSAKVVSPTHLSLNILLTHKKYSFNTQTNVLSKAQRTVYGVLCFVFTNHHTLVAFLHQ